MSRIAKKFIIVPKNVSIVLDHNMIVVKSKGKIFKKYFHSSVIIKNKNNMLFFSPKFNKHDAWMQAGTVRSLVNSMIIGITIGFSKTLKLIGVGYKVSVEPNNIIHMFLGYSHAVQYTLPDGIVAENISATEIILRSFDKQLLGQVAANLRFKRKPESYKGKGVRYVDELVRIKEAKKK
ncbi:50S ribosomal protein L6 [Buchnera aphidicola]|uniref:50S ribosomal protein L6 n=1 Tax=Buchnera aphidicola (Stegophylla sp.) TaxID=2315800 RepID=A0A4D6YBI8_9GAMM|nr:50S ribosomal protein L6 [Buchnera aphidicola (Stegophylla sp.)]QCI26472.1 50S ribosomal protein L6 [Buchnera aphidicola (Stegophylla sp.)]